MALRMLGMLGWLADRMDAWCRADHARDVARERAAVEEWFGAALEEAGKRDDDGVPCCDLDGPHGAMPAHDARVGAVRLAGQAPAFEPRAGTERQLRH